MLSSVSYDLKRHELSYSIFLWLINHKSENLNIAKFPKVPYTSLSPWMYLITLYSQLNSEHDQLQSEGRD
jgi:hypothetical protein